MSLTPTDVEIAVLTAQVTVLRGRQQAIKGYVLNTDKQAEVRDIDKQIEYIETHIATLVRLEKKG